LRLPQLGDLHQSRALLWLLAEAVEERLRLLPVLLLAPAI
jgi:hypothetical protein